MTETKSSKKYVLIMRRDAMFTSSSALVFNSHDDAVKYTGTIEEALGASHWTDEESDHNTYKVILPGPDQIIYAMTIIPIDSNDVKYRLELLDGKGRHKIREFTKYENAIQDAEHAFEEHGYSINEVESSLRASGSIEKENIWCSLRVVILDKQQKYKDRIMKALGANSDILVQITESQISIPYRDPVGIRKKIEKDVSKDDKPGSNRSIAPLIILFLVAIIMMVVLGKMIGFWGVLGVSIALYIIIYVIVKSRE